MKLAANIQSTQIVRCTLLVLTGFAFGACESLMHSVPIQQGNVITQEMVDQLEPGMSSEQVSYIMGSPVTRSTFSPEGRWDYVYTYKVHGEIQSKIRMSLYFRDDKLLYFVGDLAPQSTQLESELDLEADPQED